MATLFAADKANLTNEFEMETIVIKTDDPERNAGLIKCLQMLFPECKILVMASENQNCEEILENRSNIVSKEN